MEKSSFSPSSSEANRIIVDILAQYAVTTETTHSFMHRILAESKTYPSDEIVSTTVTQISDAIDCIDEAYQSIQIYKQKGVSLDIWLCDSLQNTIEKLPQAEQNQVADVVRAAMNNSNYTLLNSLSDGAASTNQSTDVITKGFSDLNKNVFGSEVREDIKVNTLLNSIALERIQVQSEKDNTAAVTYFASDLGDITDSNFKKVVVTAVEIAKKKQLLPNAMNNVSTIEMATIVDQGLTNIKVAHKVETGELEPIAAIEYLIDRTAARVKTVIETTCLTAGGKIGTAIGSTIGSIFGPVGTALGSQIGGVVGTAAGQKVANAINKGVEKMASVAKSVVQSASKAASSVFSSAKSWVSSWF